jgi:hypothetical protein
VNSFHERVGITNLRKHLLDWAWNRYLQFEIPKIFNLITSKKRESSRQYHILDSLNANISLKTTAVTYSTKYFQIAQNIIEGTAKATPATHGETLRDEINDQSLGESGEIN